MMDEIQKLIDDTIRMIDEYEAKLDAMEQKSRRANRKLKLTLILLVVLVTAIFIFAIGL